MAALLKSIRIQNYRSLADVSLELKPINVLFGPSGAGKSSLLDAIGFILDCVERDVELASAKRGHGYGLHFDGASTDEPIQLSLMTDQVVYELILKPSAGRIDPRPGERLFSRQKNKDLLRRRPGASDAEYLEVDVNRLTQFYIREPHRLALARYLDQPFGVDDGLALESILRSGRLYHSRSFDVSSLKMFGSPSGTESWVSERGENLWSVLRIVESRRILDDRHATIMRYMEEAFPTLQGIIIEPTAPTVLYARFLEKERREPVSALGISDGHIQLLILLTVLFSENKGSPSLVFLDEPETSLHPWALAVLGKAIHEATQSWGRQVILATHSPVLISQFEPDEQLAVEAKDGRTRITRVSEIEDIKDLLEKYATGSLYMSEVVAPQSGPIEQPASNR